MLWRLACLAHRLALLHSLLSWYPWDSHWSSILEASSVSVIVGRFHPARHLHEQPPAPALCRPTKGQVSVRFPVQSKSVHGSVMSRCGLGDATGHEWWPATLLGRSV